MQRHDNEGSRPFRRAARMLAVLCAAVLPLAGCTSPISEQRTLTFSVPACLFGSETAAIPADQGPGIDTVTVTASLSGGTAASVDGSLDSDGFGSGSYASFTITVDGKLTGITVSGTAGGTEVVSASVTDYSEAEMARYDGFTLFANVVYFKLDWSGGDSSTGTLRILPCPRSSARLLVDSGVQGGGSGVTNQASTLAALQVAMEPVAAEDNTDETLTYAVYYAVSDIDPSIEYSTATLGGTYLANPWTAQWTCAEVTGTAGRLIGDTTFVMSKLAEDPKVVGGADSSSRPSSVIDLSSSAKAGQYLLYCVLLTRAGLSVPSDVGVVEIK